MYRESLDSDFDKIQSEFLSLLEWLRFSDICVNKSSYYPLPKEIGRSDNHPILPAVTATKSDSKYIFEIFTDTISKQPDTADKLKSFCRYAASTADTDIVLVIPYGQSGIIKEWCRKNEIPVPATWEITLFYSPTYEAWFTASFRKSFIFSKLLSFPYSCSGISTCISSLIAIIIL